MMRASLLLLTLATSCCVPPAAVRPPNVLLLTNGTHGRGSGTVIAHGWILTAKHVLPVSSAGGNRIEEVFRHPDLDLALLRAPGAMWHGLTAAPQMLSVYDRVYAYGWHQGHTLLKTEGFQGQTIGTMSAPVYYGCSGGAVVDARGDLVGIIATMDVSEDSFDIIHPVPHMSGYTTLTPAVLRWIFKTLP